jgi:hypothetical protein
MSKVAKKLKSLTKSLIAATVACLIVASAPIIKDAYLRYGIGDEVVMITKSNNGNINGGTGFHVKAKSGKVYILTNKHVCEISKDGFVDVKSPSSARSIPRRIIQKYENHDLCLVEPLAGKSGLSVASSASIGEDITLIGHPNLRPLVIKKGEYIGDETIELISGYDRKTCKGRFVKDPMMEAFFGVEGVCIESFFSMQVSVTSYGGNSGSPVVDKFGKVIGVLFAGSTRVVDDAYLVPLHHIKIFLEVY